MLFKSHSIRKLFLSLLACIPFLGILSCGGGSGGSSSGDFTEGVSGPYVSGEPHLFRGAGIIGENRYLIGGPLAQARTGDVLIQNDKIRVIIQKPRRNAGIALFGGNIIDADITRGRGEAGHDNFGITFPLINVSWTPFYKKLEVINADFANGPVIVRASGVLDVYDYIQTSIIKPFAKITTGVELFFPEQFNDSLNPFQNLPKLRGVSTTVVTDYILRADRAYVIMQTHLFNNSTQNIAMPIGDWVNGSGTLETFIPGIGFTGQGQYDRNGSGGVPALIYTALESNVNASYGYFYDPTPFTKSDGTINPTGVLTVSGVSIVGLGEKLIPGVIPLGDSRDVKINFALPPGETVYARYFAVGNGDAASVLRSGAQALGIPHYEIAGRVTDSNNQAVPHARVVMIDSGDKNPVNVAYSDANGNFSATLSTGSDKKAKMFGSGPSRVEVYKEGYLDGSIWADGALKDLRKAGSCDTSAGLASIRCTLGQSGVVQVTARDENGRNVPARIGVVGFDPSPFHKVGAEEDQSIIADINFQSQQYGYLDTLLLDAQGNIGSVGHNRFVSGNSFRLEPGTYEIAVSRGPEYSMHLQRITVAPGGSASVNASIRKIMNTSGYISGDFHIHGINSPDSPYGQESRVLSATAEGLDLMVATDHDAITDYAPAIQKLGMQDQVTSIAGDEITPMAFGHFIIFPLQHKPEDPMGGAFDYTKKEGFTPGPNHHEVLSPRETFDKIDDLNEGEQVRQVAHMMDNLLGNFFLARLITTTKFAGVQPLSSYADPVEFRLTPNSNAGGNFQGPYPFGSTELFTDKFTALELCIGDVKQNQLFDTALPTWFNFINLGKRATATCSSDSHRQLMHPLGMPRNFIRSAVDPRDGTGSYSQLNPQTIAHSINQGQVIVTNGPFVTLRATSDGYPQNAEVGDTLALSGSGSKTVRVNIEVQSPDWMDWDSVEIYVNTDPTPGNDASPPTASWEGSAEQFVSVTPEGFPNHIDPKYVYQPVVRYQRGGGAGNEILNQTIAAGLRRTSINQDILLNEDSWIVVMVRGGNSAHSIFPYSPIWVNQEGDALNQANFLNTFDAQRETTASLSPTPDRFGGNKAFAFTNPVYVDIDGNGWQAKYVRSGQSPLR